MSWLLTMGRARRGYIAPARWRQIALAAVLLAGPALAAEPVPVETRPNVPYGTLPEEVGDLYLPARPGPKPAVVVIHGGGWTEGSRDAWGPFSAALAAQGVVVFNIDYRLAEAGKPSTRWPAQLLDCQLAVRFLRAHAAQLGIDSKRIGASGDSAGGQLALFLGSLPRPVNGDVAGQWPGQPSNVQAVLDQFGPVDIPGMFDGGAPAPALLFGTKTPSPAQFGSTSPLGSLTAHSAPTFIIQGDDDVTVPPGQSRQLLAALQAKHVRAELLRYPGGHGYAGLSEADADALKLRGTQWLVARLRR